jgi:hypothetical protein
MNHTGFIGWVWVKGSLDCAQDLKRFCMFACPILHFSVAKRRLLLKNRDGTDNPRIVGPLGEQLASRNYRASNLVAL